MDSFQKLYELLEQMTADGVFGSGVVNGHNPDNPVSSDFYAKGDARSPFGFDKGKPLTRFGKMKSKKKKASKKK